MPILANEVSLYPQQLLTDYCPNEELKWYVVYTRARHEKSLARKLYSKEMPFYLPLISKEQFIRGRRVRSFLPVFSGYLFYFGGAPDEVPKLARYCVSSVLPVENQDQIRAELQGIYRLLVAGLPMTIEARLSPGQTVRVRSGALKGLEGTILRRKNGNRLLVAVNYLQQGVSIEIDDFMVEPV